MTPKKHSKYPHQHRERIATSLLSLALLVALSTFVFVAQSTALYEDAYQERLSVDPAERRLANAPHSHNAPLHRTSHRHRKHRKSKTAVDFNPTLHLNQSQELAAVTSFLASLSSNVLPPGVDPSKPIDPQLVLDFQLDPTRVGGAARVEEELSVMVRDVWARNPVFMYSKLRSPISRELKSILGNLYLLPAPTIIDVDVRDDADILVPMIKRLAGFDELPLLIVGGTPVGSLNEVKVLEKSGELARMVTEAGAVVNGAKRKRRRK
ncbi:hypothetical protein BDN70DRAFT_846384 [Pholiota conissans]|uniref:Uncharacterized protein n=1 Tax=Pholiota conissans TaxID=109636 RepID=A0A9P5ZG54_9AGAR|nr:hypothetical protein BDN70DRAFT_846384 [Pholiota conissans]